MCRFFTPVLVFPNWNQYGLLKMIVINKKGTFVDGLKISNVNIRTFNLDYKSTIRFKFQIEEDAKNVGGITIFGSGFGNYNQDIKVRIAYSQIIHNRKKRLSILKSYRVSPFL